MGLTAGAEGKSVRIWPLMASQLLARAEVVPRLFVLAQGETHLGYELHDKLTLGRHPDNDIQVLDAGVSKHHFCITQRQGRSLIDDLGSQNGTQVNGQQVVQQLLRDGDIIEVGETRLQFVLQRREPGGQGLAVTVLPTQATAHSTFVTRIAAVAADEVFPGAQELSTPAELAQHYERLRAAHDLLQKVSRAEDLYSLCAAVLEQVMARVPCQRGGVLLLDQRGEQVSLAPLATRGATSGSRSLSVPEDLLRRVIDAQQGEICQAGAGLTCLTLPLLGDNEVLGLVHLESVATALDLAERDVHALATAVRPAALALANARLMERVAEDSRERQALERFFSPTLVEQVRSRAFRLQEQGRSCDATILFADIRGFVALTESLRADRVVDMLNEYFERAVEVVFAHGGVLDKFIGDAIMAVWGTTAPGIDDAQQAVWAARALQQEVHRLAVQRQQRGDPPIQVGIGIARGRVVAGLVGATTRLEYTVIGDAVNVASRLCGKARPGEILITLDALQTCRRAPQHRVLRAQAIKGKTHRIDVATLINETEG